jgi:D-alanyl-D-alanine carboxypeptidase
LAWGGAAGYLARDKSRAVRPDDAFGVASVTKNMTAVVAVKLAHEGRLTLDEPFADQLPPGLLHRWHGRDALARTTPRQLLAHTAGLPNYFTDPALAARRCAEPGHPWRPVELVDHAAAHGTPRFAPGHGFEYSDTGYVVAGILVEQATGGPLHEVYRRVRLRPARDVQHLAGGSRAGADAGSGTPLLGRAGLDNDLPDHRLGRRGLGHHRADLARFVRELWSEQIVGSRAGRADAVDARSIVSAWPRAALRKIRAGDGGNTVQGVELLGHTGFIGAFAFYAPEHDAVLAGTHNDSPVDRWPLEAALCRELRATA